jgi:hypothetical protein
MPAPKGNQYAKGNPGGGHPTFVDETLRAKVIGKCWGWLDSNFDKFTEAQKMEVSLKICAKNTPQDIDVLSGGEPFTLIVNRNGENNNAPQVSG